MLLLVIPDHKYRKRVPVQICTQVIDHLVELQQAEATWKQVHLSSLISKKNNVKGQNVLEYNLKGVKGKICIIREVLILPFMTTF